MNYSFTARCSVVKYHLGDLEKWNAKEVKAGVASAAKLAAVESWTKIKHSDVSTVFGKGKGSLSSSLQVALEGLRLPKISKTYRCTLWVMRRGSTPVAAVNVCTIEHVPG